MAILTVQNLSKYWGIDLLFQEISFLLNEGEKMALVGRNGTGKTTLLKILMGRMEHDDGNIIMPTGTRIGYLAQDPDFTPGYTLLEEAQSVFAYLQKWERDLRDLEARMGATEDEDTLASVMEEYTRVTAQYEAAGGYEAPARVKTVLFGLGFSEEDLRKPVDVLSGGQKVRLGLGKMLLEEPDLMLLDEPTNHLDLEAVQWLEGYFRNMKSAAILVSHDRYFLDRVITQTLELENNTCEIYHGNYSYFIDEKKRRMEAAMTAFERQQAEYRRLEAFYLKWRSTPSKKNQAMSRKKQMEKMELMEKPKTRWKTVGIDWEIDFESGNDVLKTENLTKAFGDQVVFTGVDVEVKKGDRIALVGPNGVGKTTFLKIIHGLLKQTAGTYFWGVGVERGYFSQDLDALDYSRTAMEEMLEIPGFTRFDAHSLLGRFLFSGEDADKPISLCSGGERNRLILAKLMVTGANVLLLDEPTNHLDLQSKEVLEDSLNEYLGSLLFVSHDRYFVDQIATKIWEFSRDGVREYEGNYTDYLAEKERLALLAAQAQAETDEPVLKPAEVTRKESMQASRTRKEEKRAAEALKRLEKQIEELESRKLELETVLADPDVYKSTTGRQAVGEYQSVQQELDALYAEWERSVS